jgi:hypothetical protein
VRHYIMAARAGAAGLLRKPLTRMTHSSCETLLIAIANLVMATAVVAQPIGECRNCTLGIWDEPELISSSGTIDPRTPKYVYMGVRYDPADSLAEVSAIVAGISGFDDDLIFVGLDLLSSGTFLQPFPAPGDTLQISAEFWGCPPARLAIIKISILAFSEITDRLLRVTPFPSPNIPGYAGPLFAECAEFRLAPVRHYCLNPRNSCAEAIEARTWGQVKSMLR